MNYLIPNRRIEAAALDLKWPGVLVCCRKKGEATDVDWNESALPAPTTEQIVAAQDAYDLYAPWLVEIRATDKTMTRQMEDYIDEQEMVLKPGRIKDAYDEKKVIRARKPT